MGEPAMPDNRLTPTAELLLRHFEQLLKDESSSTYRPNVFQAVPLYDLE